MFSAPILVMIVILPGLFSGFNMSMILFNSFGSILSLTFKINLSMGFQHEV
ncbi:hypothetical protein HanRHA438_Chr02g0067951 [Helianthus annuus]|nr:hypothetical protein HanRHA438_Chr02g0067951 [Helianthus annuus]